MRRQIQMLNSRLVTVYQNRSNRANLFLEGALPLPRNRKSGMIAVNTKKE
jgi:hypothetical protein